MVTKDLANLDSKWSRIIIKLRCSMAIFSVKKMTSLKKKTPISRFLRMDRSFEMIQELITLKKKESQKVKIQKKFKLKLKLRTRMI